MLKVFSSHFSPNRNLRCYCNSKNIFQSSIGIFSINLVIRVQFQENSFECVSESMLFVMQHQSWPPAHGWCLCSLDLNFLERPMVIWECLDFSDIIWWLFCKTKDPSFKLHGIAYFYSVSKLFTFLLLKQTMRMEFEVTFKVIILGW